MSKKRSDVSKRGQITIFMIIGLAIVIITGLFLMISNLSSSKSMGDDVEFLVEKVSTDFTPIQGYVDKCVYALGKEAVIKIGQQGGYVSSEKLVGNPISPTDGNADSLIFFPGDPSYKVAYWWYMDSSNTCDESGKCSFNTNRPDLTESSDSIETQIETYVAENIDGCLSDFRVFQSKGYEVKTTGVANSDVTIGKNDVVVQLNYPMTAKKGNRNQDMTKFIVRLPVDLRAIYDIATKVANGEGSTRYLERQALNLISVFSGTRENAVFPPMSDMNLFTEDKPKYWTRTEVANKLTTLLSNYVPMVQVVEAGNFNRIHVENEIAQAIFDMMLVKLNSDSENTDIDYGTYAIEYDYRGWWAPYLKIGTSELLGPSSMSPDNSNPLMASLMSTFKINNYKFAYDFSYPVLVRIYDPFAFNNEGYSFDIALESNVRNNFPLNTTVSEGLKSSYIESIYCNENQRLSGNITLNIKDGENNFVSGADVVYMCGSQACNIGKTSNEPFVTTLPLCMGGVLLVNEENHVPIRQNLSVSLDDSFNIDILSEKFRTKKVDVKVYRYVRGSIGWAPVSVPSDLSSTEMAMLSFSLQSDNSDSLQNFVTMVEGSEELPEIKLVPGRYDVQGNLLLELPALDRGVQKVVIPESERKEQCFLGFCAVEYTLPEIPFEDMFPEGGVYIDDAHGGSWELTAEQLDSGDTITFYVIASPGSSFANLVHEDLEEMSKIEYYSKQERLNLEPVIG